MVKKNLKTKKPGRNDPCHCGSKKKYKVCCEKEELLAKSTNLETMLRLLYCFVKGLEGQSVTITKRTVDSIPADWAEKLHIDCGVVEGLECYNVSVEKEKESLIVTPGNDIVFPGRN